MRPMRYLARVTIELTTPMLIGGDAGELSDRVFVTDANGLPTIPGTSLVGVLRHAFAEIHGAATVDNLFGFQSDNEGHGSRLAVSFGLIHDQTDTPVEGLRDSAAIDSDPVLEQARRGIMRDHVRIGHHGAVDGDGKFDQTVVAAGHRFTFELELAGTAEDETLWRQLLSLLSSGRLRLGGSTRRGLGAFVVRRLVGDRFDLTEPGQFAAYARHPVSLAAPGNLPNIEVQAKPGDDELVCLRLKPESFWMFGGGTFDGTGDGSADMLPVAERRIRWHDGRGTVGEEEILIPGSSVKGALAHRCAYYAHALAGVFADGLDEEELERVLSERPEPVIELFGMARDTDDGRAEGRSGRIFIDDIFLPADRYQQKEVAHVSIDRFTGGPIDGALFFEKPFFGGDDIPLTIRVQNPDDLSDAAREILKRALTDLGEGLLPLGGGVNRGNGVFTAQAALPAWLAGGEQ